jgi:hypothetical protein
MKKNMSLIFWLAALVAALVLVGCDGEAKDEEDDGETFTDVTASYPLATNDTNIATIGQPSNLSAAAKKSDADGTVYITVTSKTDTALSVVSDFTIANGLWGPRREQAPAGSKYADLALDLSAVFTPTNAAKVLSIRSTNHAFRYYKGATNILTDAPKVPLIGDPNIYLPATSTTELPVKWRIYEANTFTADADHNFGIILWSDAPEKVITLEVIEHSAYPATQDKAEAGELLAKIVIDYMGIVFTDAVATVADVTITGTTNSALDGTDVTLTITGDTIKTAIAASADLATWFTNLPAGLTAVAKEAVAASATSVTITVSGTPTKVSSDELAITVPAASLTKGKALTVRQRATAKFAITGT